MPLEHEVIESEITHLHGEINSVVELLIVSITPRLYEVFTATNYYIKGAFTRQSKNGTDPTKTGTVPTVFAKKQ